MHLSIRRQRQMCIRDSFIPRLSHSILPIKGKGNSNFSYSWVPVIGPVVGGVLGVNLYEFLFENTINIYLYISLAIFFLVTSLSLIENRN